MFQNESLSVEVFAIFRLNTFFYGCPIKGDVMGVAV